MFQIAMLLIGVSVAALAFVMVQTLRKAQKSLADASTALLEVREAVHTWKAEVDGLVGSVRKLTDRADHQLSSAEPLLDSVREAGEALHELAAAAHGFSSIWAAKLRRKADAAATKDSDETGHTEKEKMAALVPVSGGYAPGQGTARMEAAAAAESPGAYGRREPEPAAVPEWLEWLETGMSIARLIAKR